MRICFGPFTLDLESRQLTNAGGKFISSRRRSNCCRRSCSSGEALSKADLQERLWPGTFVAEANLSNLVARNSGGTR